MQMMSAVGSMQAAGHNKLMVQAASYPPLQRTQGRGTQSSGTGKAKKRGGRAGHPPHRIGPAPAANQVEIGTRIGPAKPVGFGLGARAASPPYGREVLCHQEQKQDYPANPAIAAGYWN